MSTVDQDLDVPAGTAPLTPVAAGTKVTSARLARAGDIEVRRLPAPPLDAVRLARRA